MTEFLLYALAWAVVVGAYMLMVAAVLTVIGRVGRRVIRLFFGEEGGEAYLTPTTKGKEKAELAFLQQCKNKYGDRWHYAWDEHQLKKQLRRMTWGRRSKEDTGNG